MALPLVRLSDACGRRGGDRAVGIRFSCGRDGHPGAPLPRHQCGRKTPRAGRLSGAAQRCMCVVVERVRVEGAWPGRECHSTAMAWGARRSTARQLWWGVVDSCVLLLIFMGAMQRPTCGPLVKAKSWSLVEPGRNRGCAAKGVRNGDVPDPLAGHPSRGIVGKVMLKK